EGNREIRLGWIPSAELSAHTVQRLDFVLADLAGRQMRFECGPIAGVLRLVVIHERDQRLVAIAGVPTDQFSHSVAFVRLCSPFASSRRRTVSPWYKRVFTVLNGQPRSSAISWNVSP